MDPLVREPHFQHIPFNKKEYDLEDEKGMAIIEFFEALHYNNGKMAIDDHIILSLPHLFFKENEVQEEFEESMVLGLIAQRGKERYELMMSTKERRPQVILKNTVYDSLQELPIEDSNQFRFVNPLEYKYEYLVQDSHTSEREPIFPSGEEILESHSTGDEGIEAIDE
ncbi:uncharacterized protein A4U43_C03F27240 [Asparagus officinalis]|uniref:Uncharacterized protein n=1 Tax=Asparagus officinalis TaxID=4686 RepID=A0A5P1FDB5_ASPOF|nr:uncharacterized protein A4U43_C03F27240 [Asparagus officinalis]